MTAWTATRRSKVWRAAAAGVAVGERAADVGEDGVVVADAAARRRSRGRPRGCARIGSPPGTSPTPVLPSESVRTTRFRVKNGPCAPLRFSSMLSWPAIGIDGHVGDDRGVLYSFGVTFRSHHDANHLSPLASGRTTRDTLSPMVRSASTISRSRCGSSRLDRHRRADRVLRGPAVAQRHRETPQARRCSPRRRWRSRAPGPRRGRRRAATRSVMVCGVNGF